MADIAAVYVSNHSFTVVGDRTVEFCAGRWCEGHCGVDGHRYAVISGSSYSAGTNLTTVITYAESDDITSNLTGVKFHIVDRVPIHTHEDVLTGGNILVEETYTNNTPVPVTIGGIEDGAVFSGATMTEMWDALLYPYQYPAFSSFLISGETTTVEVGYLVPTNRTFTWSTTNSSNVESNSISLRDHTGDITISSGLANDGSEITTSSGVQKTSAVTNVWRITGINTNTDQFTRDYTMYWRWRFYYGASTTTPLVETDIEGLASNALLSGYAGTYSTGAGGYKYICYPAVLGAATEFKDALTQLNIPFETVYTVSVTNTYGVTTNYNVHRSTNIMGGSLDIIVS